ncbi:MAG: hypothetical protein Q8O61_02270 [Nocardioides sp.]|nr:hypothetical protein [Nocardioides sp.]
MSAEEDQPGLRTFAVATGAWVVLSSAVGYVLLAWGPACNTIWDDEYRPLGSGAEAVCAGEFPFTATFLTFVVVTFVALAALILGWGETKRHARRSYAGVAALSVLAFAVLRGISLIP